MAEGEAKEASATADKQDTDGMLDVFTDVQVTENTVSMLSRELSDVSIHSLLEQTRQIALEMKRER